MRYNRDDYSACDWRRTPSDEARQKRALAEYDKWVARQAMKLRLYRLLAIAFTVYITVALFYAGSN